MTDVFSEQRKFMEACGQFIGKAPGYNDETRLWKRLIDEESTELHYAFVRFEQSFSADHLAQVASEAIDLIYVVSGLLNNLGLNATEIFNAIHAANMRKVDPATGKVTKREDGKILKPQGWEPADVFNIITNGKYRSGKP